MARRTVFNRRYRLEPPEQAYQGNRPWVADCNHPSCPWITFHGSQRTAFGYAVRHSCNPLGFK